MKLNVEDLVDTEVFPCINEVILVKLMKEIGDHTLQVALDCGAKKVLLPQTSAVDLGTVPPDLMSSFNLIFYQSAEDAVFKALGVE